MVPNPAPIGTGSFISHQRILDPPEITIFAGSSITRGRTGHRRDEDSSGLGPSNDDCDVGDGDGDDVAKIIHQERFWGQKGRTGDVGTEGGGKAGKGERKGGKGGKSRRRRKWGGYVG